MEMVHCSKAAVVVFDWGFCGSTCPEMNVCARHAHIASYPDLFTVTSADVKSVHSF